MRILHAQHAGEAQRFACASTAHAALELRERMMKLLAGEDPDPQDVLLAGYQCAELYQMVTAAGFEVISWGDHQAKLTSETQIAVKNKDIVVNTRRRSCSSHVERSCCSVTKHSFSLI